MKNVLSALTLAICAVGSTQAAPVQWSIGSGGNDHWYEFFATAVDWHAARADALGRGAYLATLTSAAEDRFASATVAGGQLAWIGGTDEAAEGVWKWADGPEAGNALAYFNWNGGEPNDTNGGEDYLQTNWGSSGQWNDHGGPGNAGQVNGYLVEYDLVINPTNGVPEPLTLAMVASGLLAAVVTRRRRA